MTPQAPEPPPPPAEIEDQLLALEAASSPQASFGPRLIRWLTRKAFRHEQRLDDHEARIRALEP
jgi:hypothetical protein